MRRSVSSIAIATLAVAWIAGCAPERVRVPDLTAAPRRARFETALAARLARTAADVEFSAWASGTALPDFPGVQARLVLVAPDAFRLRVASLFGTALDVAARGDSFTAYVPPRRMVLETGTARESLGIGDPGGLGYRAWAATWQPPGPAWDAATWQDSLLVLRWEEGGDSVRIAIGGHGLPRWVERARGAGAGVRTEYQAWSPFDGVLWPVLVIVTDSRGAYGLRCKVQTLQFKRVVDRARMVIEVPDDAERVTRQDLRRALERLGKL